MSSFKLTTAMDDHTSAATKLQAVRRGQRDRQALREQADAATKVQAVRRGQQARRNGALRAAPEPPPPPAEEEVDVDEEEDESPLVVLRREEAATMMQAARRGQQSRRALQVEYAYGLPVKPAFVADDDELSAAATKLQAARRGQQDRRQVHQQAAAAATVQAARRGQRDRREMREQAAAATRLQSVRRGQLSRREMPPKGGHEDAAFGQGGHVDPAEEPDAEAARRKAQVSWLGDKGIEFAAAALADALEEVSEAREALAEATEAKRAAEGATRAAERTAATVQAAAAAAQAAATEAEKRAAVAESERESATSRAVELQRRLEAAERSEQREVELQKAAERSEQRAVELQRRLEAAERALKQHEEKVVVKEVAVAQRAAAALLPLPTRRPAAENNPMPAEIVVAQRSKLEGAVRAARDATERAETAEARAAVLAEKLSSADVQLKMLRAQLHKLQDLAFAPAGAKAHRGLNGRLYHPTSAPAKLPTIESGGAVVGGAVMSGAVDVAAYESRACAAGGEAHRQGHKKPPMDLRTLMASDDL